MNKPDRFDPVPVMHLADGSPIHESTRTSMSTNTAPCGTRTLSIATTGMSMRVNGGVLEVRFKHRVINGPARLPMARARRAPMRR